MTSSQTRPPVALNTKRSRCAMRIMAKATRTCQSGKKGYTTHRKALVALEAIRTDPTATERHIYRCVCGQWHLTSL